MDERKSFLQKRPESWIGIGLAIGAGVGVAINSLAMGVGIGMLIGAIISIVQKRKLDQ